MFARLTFDERAIDARLKTEWTRTRSCFGDSYLLKVIDSRPCDFEFEQLVRGELGDTCLFRISFLCCSAATVSRGLFIASRGWTEFIASLRWRNRVLNLNRMLAEKLDEELRGCATDNVSGLPLADVGREDEEDRGDSNRWLSCRLQVMLQPLGGCRSGSTRWLHYRNRGVAY